MYETKNMLYSKVWKLSSVRTLTLFINSIFFVCTDSFRSSSVMIQSTLDFNRVIKINLLIFIYLCRKREYLKIFWDTLENYLQKVFEWGQGTPGSWPNPVLTSCIVWKKKKTRYKIAALLQQLNYYDCSRPKKLNLCGKLMKGLRMGLAWLRFIRMGTTNIYYSGAGLWPGGYMPPQFSFSFFKFLT